MTWDELITEIYALTKRDDLAAETAIALRNTVRASHNLGRFWRDLVSIPVTNLSTSTTIQEIDLASQAPRFKQLARLTPADYPDVEFTVVAIDDLFENDGYNIPRSNICWGFGSVLKVRAATAYANYTLEYYQHPIVTPTSQFSSWIADDHGDLLVLGAAMTVLDLVGEQEIRGRLEKLYVQALSNLMQTATLVEAH